jgi:hypothetical protein
MTDAPELFDKFGRFDISGITPEIVEATMDEAQQSAFFACVADCQATDKAEERERVSVVDVREKMRLQVAALAAHVAANPPQTRIEAMREVQAAQNGTPQVKADPKSHPKIGHKGPRLEYEKSERELTAARDEMLAAQADVRRLRPISATSLMKFIASFKQKSADQVYREHIAGQQAERIRRVAEGLPAEPVKPVVVHQWPISGAVATNGMPKKAQFFVPRK